MLKLGQTATDRITGFTGIITGRVEYISGCNQVLVAPKSKPEGELIASQWFDEQRMTVNDTVGILVLENGEHPGADKAAPKR